MTKLCPRGKAAAKRKFKVYPSAHMQMPTHQKFVLVKLKIRVVKKEKILKVPNLQEKLMGGIIDFNKVSQDRKKVSQFNNGGIARGCGAVMESKRKSTKMA